MPAGIADGNGQGGDRDWAVYLHAAHPGYISWGDFMANQGPLADNVVRYEAGHSGVPHEGVALLPRNCDLRPLRTAHEHALHGLECRLSYLLLPLGSGPARQCTVSVTPGLGG